MNTKYVLCAGGSVSLPQLNIDVNAGTDDLARDIAKDMTAALSKADYFSFYLYDIATSSVAARLIGTLRVETPEPIVNVKPY